MSTTPPNPIVAFPADLVAAQGMDLPKEPQRLTLRKPSEIVAMEFTDDDSILGDRLLEKGGSLSMLGAGGLGKSRFVLQCQAAATTGRSFLGIATRAMGLKWLNIQAENSNRRLKFDLEHIRKWVGEDDWNLVNENVLIHTIESDDDAYLAIENAENVKRIADLIAETKPDIVVFDTLSNLTLGDLNKDQDMNNVWLRLSQLVKAGNPMRAMVLLHHALPGKAGAIKATGYDRAAFGRNSKVLHARTRAQINLTAASEDNNDALVVSCGKNSNGKEFEPFGVKLNLDTMIYEVDSSFSLDSWQADISGKKEGPKVSDEMIAELAKSPIGRPQLVKAIRSETGCASSLAYRRIDYLIASKVLHLNSVNKTIIAR